MILMFIAAGFALAGTCWILYASRRLDRLAARERHPAVLWPSDLFDLPVRGVGGHNRASRCRRKARR